MPKPLRDSIRDLNDDPTVTYVKLMMAVWEAKSEGTDQTPVSVQAKAVTELGENRNSDQGEDQQ